MSQIKVPIDDTHTWFVTVAFDPTPDATLVAQPDDQVPVEYHRASKRPRDQGYPFVRHSMEETLEQDLMAWETQGPISDRTSERLGTSDRWIVEFREMLWENLARLRDGLDPCAVIRDRDHATIVTNLDTNLPGRRARGGASQGRRG